MLNDNTIPQCYRCYPDLQFGECFSTVYFLYNDYFCSELDDPSMFKINA